MPVLRAPHEYLDFVSDSELVPHNSFIGQAPDRSIPPTLAAVRERLPQPFWDGGERGRAALGCYWKTWELCFRNLKAVTDANGFVAPYIDTAFNDCLFQWDSCFILLFARYASRAFAFQRTLDNLYAKQHHDGFICREVHEWDGGDQFHYHDPASTGPNVLAWCEWEAYCNFGDKTRLRKIFPVLLGYHAWLRKHRTWPDGSYHSCGLACGMDNQPRVLPGDNPLTDHAWTAWVDATAQAILSARLLVRMSEELGGELFREQVAACRSEAARLTTYMQEHMWDEATHTFADRRLQQPALSSTRTVGAYWTLLADVVPRARLQPFLEALDDPRLFNRPVRVPALAASHPQYARDGGYWNGGVWAPTTYMVLRGLSAVGADDIAADIGANYHQCVVSVWEATGTLWENLAPEPNPSGDPIPGSPSKPDFVGWSGLGPVAVLFEYVFGFRADVPKKALVIDVRLLDKYGCKRYPFGDADLDIEVAARTSLDAEPAVSVTWSSTCREGAMAPLTVDVRWGRTATRAGGVRVDRGSGVPAVHQKTLRVEPTRAPAAGGSGSGGAGAGGAASGGRSGSTAPRGGNITLAELESGLSAALSFLNAAPKK